MKATTGMCMLSRLTRSNLTANTIVLRGEAVGWGEGWTHKGFSVQIWRPGFDFLEEDEEEEELQLGIYNHNTGEA